MRGVFVVMTGFFTVVAVLCAVRVASVTPDHAAVVRWTSGAVGAACIAAFWEVVRRRYIARGTLTADPVVAGLGLAVLGVLVVVALVFRATR